MKILYTVIALCLAQVTLAQAQTIEKTLPYKGQSLDFNLNFGTEVVLKSWDKDEVYVKIIYQINEGKDNEVLEYKIEQGTDKILIDITLDDKKLNKLGNCCCNNSKGNYWRSSNGKEGRVCVEVKVEVSMPAQADIKAKTVVADVSVAGFIGNLDIETVTGSIDLYWAEQSGADVSIETVNGGIFTELDLKMETKDELPKISSHKVKASYKNGGKQVKLKTVTSNIYLRAALK